MPYGILKIDTITFTDGGVDKSVPVSGLVQNPTFTGNITVTGTISGNIIQGGTTVSGLTVTGTTANFASGVFTTQISGVTLTGTTVAATTGTFTSLTGTTTNGTTASFTTGNFTSLTGTTTTGTTANFASGVFTTQVSGLLITGPTVSATTGTFTSLTGTTTTGTTANFASGVFTTQISGVTITGTTVSTTTGNFTSLTGTTATITSGIIASGTAALPSLAILSDPNTGIYSPGADQLAVATNGTSRLSIDASGNVAVDTNTLYVDAVNNRVGIGSTSPGTPLTVSASSNAFISVTNSTASATNFIGTNASGDLDLNGNGSQNMLFKIAGNEAARFDSSRRLLVGTTTARDKFFGGLAASLQVEGSTTAFCSLSITRNDATGDSSKLVLAHARGTSNQILIADDAIGDISWQGADGNKFIQAAHIRAFVDGTPGVDDMPGRLVFSTTADGASSPTERMRIDSAGNILVGQFATTTPGRGNTTTGVSLRPVGTGYFSVSNELALALNRNTADGAIVSFFREGLNVGNISVTTTATTYNTISDYRLKENVAPLTGAVNRLKQLHAHCFNFLADPGKTVDGFMAHEAQAVVPECVTGEKNAVDDDGNPVYQGIDQSKLVPLLTAALQEAIARIEQLEAAVTTLQQS